MIALANTALCVRMHSTTLLSITGRALLWVPPL